jgi:hypothetical protein
MKELAKEVSELRYDALFELIKNLRLELQKDVVEDAARGRVLLSSHLSNAAGHLCSVENSIEHCWNIAKTHKP